MWDRARRFAKLSLAALFLVLPVAQGYAAESSSLDCVTHRTEARYSGYGYDHFVHLENGCAKKARCVVSTNVNPEKQTVMLDAGAKQTVATFRGSPAREFQATVECTDAG